MVWSNAWHPSWGKTRHLKVVTSIILKNGPCLWRLITLLCFFFLNVVRVRVCVCGHHFNVSSCLSGPGGQRSSTEELERNSHRSAGHPHHLFPDCHLRYPADPKYVHTTQHKRKHKHMPVGCAVHTRQFSPSVYLDHSALWHLCALFFQHGNGVKHKTPWMCNVHMLRNHECNAVCKYKNFIWCLMFADTVRVKLKSKPATNKLVRLSMWLLFYMILHIMHL